MPCARLRTKPCNQEKLRHFEIPYLQEQEKELLSLQSCAVPLSVMWLNNQKLDLALVLCDDPGASPSCIEYVSLLPLDMKFDVFGLAEQTPKVRIHQEKRPIHATQAVQLSKPVHHITISRYNSSNNDAKAGPESHRSPREGTGRAVSHSREAELDVRRAATLQGSVSPAGSHRSERKKGEEVYSPTEEVLRGHPYFRSIHQFLRTGARQAGAADTDSSGGKRGEGKVSSLDEV
ncbi:hypothetical protein RRG08_025931 [Elysia crispata]|uniref:Uncharacterized protein n=1 Tax=Elysia crispata TaxID=231223 RepID=A0AAE0ZZ98_9GAST|nr:hypothetical protein RRG08_025931 [Elysia crispata]